MRERERGEGSEGEGEQGRGMRRKVCVIDRGIEGQGGVFSHTHACAHTHTHTHAMHTVSHAQQVRVSTKIEGSVYARYVCMFVCLRGV